MFFRVVSCNGPQRFTSGSLYTSSSVYQILKRELKLTPYIPRLHQKLNEDDPDRRLEYCEVFVCMLNDDP